MTDPPNPCGSPAGSGPTPQPHAYRLAAELEAAGVPVVLGGTHVTFLPDEALEHARYVVRGEGERTMCELGAALDRETPLADIRGLSWRDAQGRLRHNPPRPRCSQEQFEALPIPDLSLITGHERMAIAPVMTQWGCPFDCEFCAVTTMFSRHVRHRRTDQILAELAGLNTGQVFFHVRGQQGPHPRPAARNDHQGLTPEWFAQVRAAES